MHGIQAYKKTMEDISSPRDQEAKVISAITKGLERHASEGPKSASLKDYLVKNQRLWVAVRNDTGSEGNTLPQALRAQLVSLSLWVERHTTSVLTGEGDVQELIDINRSLIAGLSGQAPAKQATAQVGA